MSKCNCNCNCNCECIGEERISIISLLSNMLMAIISDYFYWSEQFSFVNNLVCAK